MYSFGVEEFFGRGTAGGDNHLRLRSYVSGMGQLSLANWAFPGYILLHLKLQNHFYMAWSHENVHQVISSIKHITISIS